MKLSNYTIITLREIIIGDSGIRMPRQSGKQVTDLFNAFCIKKEIYPDDWIPTDKEVACSRKQYAEKRLRELNNTYQLSKLIERIVQADRKDSSARLF